MSKSFIGTFYVPGLNEQELVYRTYVGYGDPNLLPEDYFQPTPKPNDRYLQLDADPVLEWVYNQYGYWIEVSRRFDNKPPDYTKIMDVI